MTTQLEHPSHLGWMKTWQLARLDSMWTPLSCIIKCLTITLSLRKYHFCKTSSLMGRSSIKINIALKLSMHMRETVRLSRLRCSVRRICLKIDRINCFSMGMGLMEFPWKWGSVWITYLPWKKDGHWDSLMSEEVVKEGRNGMMLRF